MNTDWIAIVISIIALIVSIIGAAIGWKKEASMNSVNLEAEYFNAIYKDYLIKEIPNARKYIRFDNEGTLTDIQKMCDVLNAMRNDSLYYLYNDKAFYEKLKTKSQTLEDYLMVEAQKTHVGEMQTTVFEKIQALIKEIYECVNDKYLGKV